MLSDKAQLKQLYLNRPKGGHKWSYWFNLFFTGYTHYSDHINFEECVKYEEKIMDLQQKIYGRWLLSSEEEEC